jgi:hypothetical protein
VNEFERMVRSSVGRRTVLPDGRVAKSCNRCGAEIVWARDRDGKTRATDLDGELHAASCADLEDDR